MNPRILASCKTSKLYSGTVDPIPTEPIPVTTTDSDGVEFIFNLSSPGGTSIPRPS